jgi:hypothetical protein
VEISWLWDTGGIMEKVVFDTNFCVVPFQFKVDIFSELEKVLEGKCKIIVPTVCIEELKNVEYGMAALDLLEKKNAFFVDIPKTGNVDDSIINFALNNGALIATQDAELKKKAKKEGIPIVTLRQKKHLIIEYK